MEKLSNNIELSVRPYLNSDWEMISRWWVESGEVGPPLKAMMPLESSFIAELDGVPAVAVALYLTNSIVVYAENFIGNPHLKGDNRCMSSSYLADYVAEHCKSLGYRCIFCLTEKPALVKKYEALGFKPTLRGVTTLVRSL